VKVVLFQSHVLKALKEIPDNSIDMVITSPPYYGLRMYPSSANVIWDGDENCEHEFENGFCKKCNAWFGQLGLEPSPELYLQHLKQVMIELKRVLKPTGTIWWNMGDTYGGSLLGYGVKDPNYIPTGFQDARKQDYYPSHSIKPPQSKIMKKCLLMLPERFAWICISELGLTLRNKIIWYKPNALPSSVKDRFSNKWEYVFLFSKSKKYYFNLDAVRIPPKNLKNSSFNYRVREAKKGYFGKMGVKASEEEMERYDNKGCKIDNSENLEIIGKNPGDLWEIKTQPFHGAHFATFPEELVRRAIRAGCPEQVCKRCGRPKEIILKREHKGATKQRGKYSGLEGIIQGALCITPTRVEDITEVTCNCNAGFEPGTILDPFVGSGTTIKVAIEERRNCIGIEIVPEYVEMTMKRCNLPNPFVDFKLITI